MLTREQAHAEMCKVFQNAPLVDSGSRNKRNDGWIFSEMWVVIKVLDTREVVDLSERMRV